MTTPLRGDAGHLGRFFATGSRGDREKNLSCVAQGSALLDELRGHQVRQGAPRGALRESRLRDDLVLGQRALLAEKIVDETSRGRDIGRQSRDSSFRTELAEDRQIASLAKSNEPGR